MELRMPDLAAAKARLEASLVELEGRLATLARDLSEPPSSDWEDLAIEQEDDEALEHQGLLVEREIASVRRALGRIQDGTYGTCVRCGEEVAPERLAARPEAALCINCARSAM
jgi:RNA polymerase-binding transcription factor DksA